MLRAALGLVFLTGCFVTTSDDGTDSTLTVENQSSFTIEEVHVAPVESTEWGPNLVPEALLPGEAVDIDVSCGTYDVLVVDETNTDCVLTSFDLCFSSGTWVVTDATLDRCAFG
jgi:hypothetical protein